MNMTNKILKYIIINLASATPGILSILGVDMILWFKVGPLRESSRNRRSSADSAPLLRTVSLTVYSLTKRIARNFEWPRMRSNKWNSRPKPLYTPKTSRTLLRIFGGQGE